MVKSCFPPSQLGWFRQETGGNRETIPLNLVIPDVSLPAAIFDLYARLATENTGENLFFSPYSISTALLMTTEGARADTADEMGKVLGFPEALRRTGGDAQKIPWETGKLHVGLTALNRLFNRERETPEQVAFEEKLAASEKLLVETKALNAELREQKDWNAYRKNVEVEKRVAMVYPKTDFDCSLWAEPTTSLLRTYRRKRGGKRKYPCWKREFHP
jgi:hypothetical protein